MAILNFQMGEVCDQPNRFYPSSKLICFFFIQHFAKFHWQGLKSFWDKLYTDSQTDTYTGKKMKPVQKQKNKVEQIFNLCSCIDCESLILYFIKRCSTFKKGKKKYLYLTNISRNTAGCLQNLLYIHIFSTNGNKKWHLKKNNVKQNIIGNLRMYFDFLLCY